MKPAEAGDNPAKRLTKGTKKILRKQTIMTVPPHYSVTRTFFNEVIR
jgi:hypothetical protein